MLSAAQNQLQKVDKKGVTAVGSLILTYHCVIITQSWVWVLTWEGFRSLPLPPSLVIFVLVCCIQSILIYYANSRLVATLGVAVIA